MENLGKYSALGAVLVGLACISYSQAATPIHGGWTPWSVLSTECSAQCGGGTWQKIRTCTNPSPANGGRDCQDMDNLASEREIHNFPCNEQSCWYNDPIWMPWTECNTVCGRGTRSRSPNCTGDAGCGSSIPPDEEEACNTWNRTTCPSPCDDYKCFDFAICNDVSNDVDPKVSCSCVMDYILNDDKTNCVRPPPTTPTPRPIPTLPAEQKVVATVISKTASSVLIFFVTLTLIVFFVLRIFSPDRVIQMNMEIALLTGHLFLLFPPSITSSAFMCKVVSIALHYFFTACFTFMMLEAVHMYTMVGFVVKKNGLFTRVQNILIGWGVPAIICGLSAAFEWDSYGGEYHCWLQMNTPLLIAQQLPIIALMIMTFTLIEAAGEAEYKPLKCMDYQQVTSAKFSQRTNLVIVPFVYAHWVLGTLSEYQQNLALYGIFSIVNGWLGACVFFFHCSNNQQVREKLKNVYYNLRQD